MLMTMIAFSLFVVTKEIGYLGLSMIYVFFSIIIYF